MKNLHKIIGLFSLLLVLSITGCKKEEYSFGVMKTPSSLALTTTIVGLDNANPAGDGTGAVTINITASNAITYNGASPIFLDVDLDTMGLSSKAVSAFLEEFGDLREDGCFNKKTGKKISACLPMHTFGFPVHLDELKKTCDEWNIPIIEDAAEY